MLKPLLILVAFSSLLGVLGGKAYGVYQKQQYRPRWERASLISPRAPAAVAYYRYNFALDAAPERAYLQLAAPDYFQLFVNGVDLGEGAYTSVMASGWFDVGARLVAGKNTIAVSVIRKTYPGTPDLIAEGVWQSISGQSGVIATDATWRVSVKEESQGNEATSWTAVEFNDQHWTRAVAQAVLSASVVSPFDFPPDLLWHLPRGESIWLPHLEAQNGTFRRTLDLDGQVTGAWMGVATAASYTLSVNNIVVETGNPTRGYMDVYDIGPYLRAGRNIFELNVSHVERGGWLIAAGTMVVDGQTLDFSSDQRWTARLDASPVAGMAPWMPVRVLGKMEPVSMRQQLVVEASVVGLPTIRVVTVTPTAALLVRRTEQYGPWIAGALVINVLAAVFFHLLYKMRSGVGLAYALEAYATPQAVGILCLLLAFLCQYDIRFDADIWMNADLFHAVWMIMALWEVFILGELYLRTSRRARSA